MIATRIAVAAALTALLSAPAAAQAVDQPPGVGHCRGEVKPIRTEPNRGADKTSTKSPTDADRGGNNQTITTGVTIHCK